MAETTDIPAWIVLFIGLYSLAASIGEWRTPGFWAAMLGDFVRLPGLRFVTGFFVLSLAAAVYTVNPWRPDAWLAVLVTVTGGTMVLGGALILALGHPCPRLAPWLMGRAACAAAALSAPL